MISAALAGFQQVGLRGLLGSDGSKRRGGAAIQAAGFPPHKDAVQGGRARLFLTPSGGSVAADIVGPKFVLVRHPLPRLSRAEGRESDKSSITLCFRHQLLGQWRLSNCTA